MRRLIAISLASAALSSFAPASFGQHEGHAMQQHRHGSPQVERPAANDAGAPSPSPAPAGYTAAEHAAAFPAELEGMDMSAHMDDDPLVWVLRGDELERGEHGTLGWDLRAGIGRNFDRLWLRSEGERSHGDTEHASTELMWSHATGPWWDRTLGVRHDTGGAGPSRDWLAFGVQGLAPYKFELEATGYVGESGRLAARLEGEYEVLLTNRLILQPKLEANLYGRDDPANRVGSGLSDVEFGLRLRYEFSPRFAPYVGHAWTRRFGATADLFEAAGEDASERRWVAGVRFWF